MPPSEETIASLSFLAASARGRTGAWKKRQAGDDSVLRSWSVASPPELTPWLSSPTLETKGSASADEKGRGAMKGRWEAEEDCLEAQTKR